jgi:hypothetical protein
MSMRSATALSTGSCIITPKKRGTLPSEYIFPHQKRNQVLGNLHPTYIPHTPGHSPFLLPVLGLYTKYCLPLFNLCNCSNLFLPISFPLPPCYFLLPQILSAIHSTWAHSMPLPNAQPY